MTQRAKNSIDLYKGGNPEKIKLLLNIQDKSVVNELKEHFHAEGLDDLAVKLSMA